MKAVPDRGIIAHPPNSWFSCPFLHIFSILTCLPDPFKLPPAGLA